MPLDVAEGIQYDPDRHCLVIDGVEFSPEFLAAFTRNTGAWRGPYWIRRSPIAPTAEITTVDPNQETDHAA